MKVVKLGTTDYGCLEPGESPYMTFPHRRAALALLNRLRREPGGMETIRGLLRDAGGASLPSELSLISDDDVVLRVAGLLVNGRLKLMRLPAASPAPAEAAPAREEPAPPPPLEPMPAKEAAEPAEPAPAADDTHWVELVVVEADGGAPVSGVTAKLKLPGGGVEELVTGADGKIRKASQPQGSWEIQQLDSDEVLEVVEVS